MALGGVPDYCVIGHVTRDLLPAGGESAGGTATYSALAAAHLGYQVGVLTSADACQTGQRALAPLLAMPSVQVVSCPAPKTTTFENIYQRQTRRQYIRSTAAPLSLSDLPDGWSQAPILHLGPVANEIAPDQTLALLKAFHGLRGLTPQGWMRSWDKDGRVWPCAWQGLDELLHLADVIILSPEDVGDQRDMLSRLEREARLLVVTLGHQGALVIQQGRAQRVPAFAVEVIDPTGAGDVFATALLLRLHQTQDVLEAALYANCVASFVIQGPGASCLPAPEQVQERLQQGRLRD